MNRVDFISVRDIIEEWIEETGLSKEEINREILTRQALDCNEWLCYADNLINKIVLLNTKLGRIEKPADMVSIVQIAYRKRPKKTDACTTIETVSQWVQHDYENDVDIEINVRCNKCSKKKCDCNSNAIEVNIDDLWRAQNPHHNYFGKFARAGKFGVTKSHYSDQFKIMKYAGNDFHAINLHIPQCHNLSIIDCEHKYVINRDIIQTDIREDGTEILLSYLSHPTDELGDPMLPKTANVIEAIKSHLSHKYFKKKYHSEGLEVKYRNAYKDFELDRENYISLARAELTSLGFHELHSIFSSVLYGQVDVVGKKYTDYGRVRDLGEQEWLL